MATLRTEALTKSYGGRTVVRGVSVEVRSGEVVGLLGPNGAGKTTTFYMAVGLTTPDSGPRAPQRRGRHRRSDVHPRPEGHRVPAAGAVRLPGPDGRAEHLRPSSRRSTSRPPSGAPRLRDLLAELNLTPLADSPAYTLSGGERRRVEITRALVISPQFILLDEPFAGIDPIAVADIQKIIFAPERPRHRRAHHGPQRAGDTAHHGSRVHRQRRRDLPERDAREPRGRRRRAAHLSRRRFPAGLRPPEGLDSGLAAMAIQQKTPHEARPEADPDALAAAGDQAAADVDARAGGSPEPGGRREPDARGGAVRGEPAGRRGRAGEERRASRDLGAEGRRLGRQRLRATSSATTSTTGTGRGRSTRSRNCRRSRTRCRRPRRWRITCEWQLSLQATDETTRDIGDAIIGNLDDDGYLVASVDEIAAMGELDRRPGGEDAAADAGVRPHRGGGARPAGVPLAAVAAHRPGGHARRADRHRAPAAAAEPPGAGDGQAARADDRRAQAAHRDSSATSIRSRAAGTTAATRSTSSRTSTWSRSKTSTSRC